MFGGGLARGWACRRRHLGLWVVLTILLSGCSRLGDITGPTPIGGVVSTVTMATPTVTLSVGATAALQVSARDASGRDITDRPVIWSSSDSSIVQVSPTGVVTAVGTGVAQVSASVAGRSALAEVTVVQRPVSSIEIGPLAPRVLVGGFIQLVALPRDETGTPLPDRPVFWSSSDATIASVDATGFVSGRAAGVATVTARSEEREAAVGVVVELVPVASVIVSPRQDTIVVGQSTQLAAVPRDSLTIPLVDRVIAWSTSNPAVATVSAAGVVIAVSPGIARITADVEGVLGDATVVVQPRPIGAVIVSPAQSTITVGQTLALTVQITDGSGNLLTGRPITYGSDNPGVAQVGTDGVVRGVGAGSTTIRAMSEGQTGTMSVVVQATPVASVRLLPLTSTVMLGDSVQLSAVALDNTGAPLGQRAITWTSGAPSVLSVSPTGLVRTLSAGTGLVFAQIDGRLAAATVTVLSVGVGAVQVSPPLANVVIGATFDLTASIRDANGSLITRPIAWSSSNPLVAVVTSAGRVRALTLGTTRIDATVEGAVGSSTITVIPVPVGTVTVTLGAAALNVGQTTQATAVVRDATNTILPGRVVVWSSSNPAVATVSASGVVTAVGGGSANIIATSEGVSGNAPLAVSQVVASLAVVTQPAGAVSGAAFTTQPVVRVLDAQGNVVTTGAGATIAVTVSRATGTATLSGTTTVNAVAGVATFTDLAFGGPGIGAHTLRFSTAAPELAVNSASFTVLSGPATTVSAASSVSQTAQVASNVSEPPRVRVTDAGGNPVSGINVVFAITAGVDASTAPSSGSTVTSNAAGIAALTRWTLSIPPGTNTVRATASGLTGSPVTFSATATIGSPSRVAITTQPAGAVSGVPLTTQPIVEVQDAAGNRLTTATDAITVSIATGDGAIVGTTTVNAVAGVATFSGLRINGAGAHTLRFAATGLTAATSTTLNVTQVAASLALQQQPSGAASGAPFTTQPVVRILDNAGLLVTTGTGATLTVAASIASGSGTLSGTGSVAAVGGVATFPNLALSGIGPHTLRFSTASPALNVVSATISVTPGAPANITAQSPVTQSAAAATAVGSAPSVRVTDAAGNAVSGVSVTFAVTAGGGSTVPVSGSTVVTNASGLATLTSWTMGPAPGTNTVTATATGLIGSPVTFTATATVGAPTQLAITTQPAGAVSGTAFTTQPVVQIRDANGNLVSSSSLAVTATVASGTGSAAGTVTVNAVNGVATFTGLRIDGGGDHTLQFSATGLTAATSNTIAVSQVVSSLAIQTQPAGASSGAPLATQPVVRILDGAGRVVTTGSGATAPVSVTLASGTGSLGGTLTINAASGVATFTNVSLTGSGAHTLRFALASPSVEVVSQSVVIGAGAPSVIAAASDQNQSAPVSSSVVAPSVLVTDAQGNGVSGVAVTFTVTAGGGTIVPASGGTVATNQSGVATLTSWTLGAGAGTNTVTASVAGLTGSPVTFNATGTAVGATQLALTTQPIGAVSGVAFTTQPVVEVRDAGDQLVSGSTVAVTATIASGTGQLIGTQTVNAVNGIATFTNLQLNGRGDHSLQFAATALSAATSNTFAVTQVAASLSMATQPAGAASGIAFTTQPIVQILDNAGLVVTTGAGATLTVTAAIASGTGTLGGTTPVNAVNGVATFADLSLTGSGSFTLDFSTAAPALSIVSNTITVGAGAPTAIAADSPVDQTAGVSTTVMAPAVVVRDGAANPVSGVNVTFTITAGDGSIVPASGNPVSTDANGRAALTTWTLGATPGVNTVTATVAGLTGSPVTFNATGTAVAATQLAITTQPSGAVSGVAFTTQPVVEVRDAGNQLVSAATVAVTATIASGTGQLIGTQVVNAVNGVATFTNLQINGRGNHTLQFAATGLTAATSNTIPVTQVAASLSVATQPAGASSGAAFTTQPVVQILDNAGLVVTTGAGATLAMTAAIASGTGGTLGGTTSVNAVDGVVTFSDLSLTGSGSYTLNFSTASPSLSIVSSTITMSAGAPTTIAALSSVNQSAAVATNVTPPSVLVTDAAANPVSGVNVTFTVTAGDGSIVPASGNTVATNVNGEATLTSWTLGATPGANTVMAAVAGLVGSPVAFNATGTTAAATQVVLTTQPTGAVSGLALTTQPVVEIRDASNAIVSTSSAAVTAAIASGSGALQGTLTVNAVNGVATFTNLRVNGAGSHTLQFTSDGLTAATSTAFDVTQQAASLQLQIQPAGAVNGEPFTTQPIVRILDHADLPVTTGAGATLQVDARIASGTGSIGGTTSVNAVDGVASFSNLLIIGTGIHTIAFETVTPALSVVSAALDVQPAAPIASLFQPLSATEQSGAVSATVTPPSIRVADASDNPVSGVDVTFTITAGNGSITPASPAVITTNASGMASLTTWTLGATPGVNTVTASAPGIPGSPVEFSATGTAPSATQLVITTQPNGAVSGLALTSQPIIEVRDASNALVATSSAAVTASIASGSGVLVGTQTVNAVNGVVTFTNLRIDGTGTHRLEFTSGNLAPATSGTITVRQQAASLLVQTQPSGAISGAQFTVQPVVHILDHAGLLVTTGDDAQLDVQVTRATGSATLQGNTSTEASGGIATFTDLAFTELGTGLHSLRFELETVGVSVISATFNVSAGAADKLEANSALTQTATVGTNVDTVPSVRVIDANQNPVAGVPVVFTVISGGGSIDPASGDTVRTNASGVASLTRWTLGSVAGDNMVSATVSALSGSPVEFKAVGAPPEPAGLAVLQQPSRAEPSTVFVQQPLIEIRDAAGTRIATSALQVTASIESGNGTLLGTRTVAAVGGLVTFTNLAIDGRGGHVLRFSSAEPPLSVLASSFPVVGGGLYERAMSVSSQPAWYVATAEH